jgi:hypothetical protein
MLKPEMDKNKIKNGISEVLQRRNNLYCKKLMWRENDRISELS